jgi:hypothetical protein
MAVNKSQFIDTLSDVFNFMAPFAGGAIPSENSDEYGYWLAWVCNKMDEASKYAHWRRLLTKTTITLTEGDDFVYLPDNFGDLNGIHLFDVNGVDWNEPGNTDEMSLFVEINGDSTDADYGKWRVRFNTTLTATTTATLWYFFVPAFPEVSTDKIVLPGDMIAYGALSEHFRSSGAEGSQDDARNEYLNRLTNYLAQERIPSKHELLSVGTHFGDAVNHISNARTRYYSSRSMRYRS